VRGYVHEVVISCGAEVIARHPRSYEREDFVFEPGPSSRRIPHRDAAGCPAASGQTRRC
jgi:hypothetical protein